MGSEMCIRDSSWFVLLFILIFTFSGQEITIGSTTFSGIQVDTEFMKNNLTFIAGGVSETIKISIMSIVLAMNLALFAAL